MGTRAYYCYRFRGRIYVYYNYWDSYPTVLGRFLINNIPTDPEKYKEWLSKVRAQYAELEKVLDEKILTLPNPGTVVTYTIQPYGYGNPASTSPLFAWQFHVNERLVRLPDYYEEPSDDLWIEWVYTIDLDREIVQIKSHSTECSYGLYSIPRLDWAKDFEEEEEDEEEDEQQQHKEDDGKDQGCEKVVPVSAKIPIGQPFAALLTPDAPPKSLIDKYDSLTVTLVKPKRLARMINPGQHVYSIKELLFTHFIEQWSDRLSNHILLCRSVDFIFREAVFAILCLASGDFTLLADQSPVSDRGKHLKERLGSPYGASVLPDFGSGMHHSGVQPGSAPNSSSYWFKGVLVLLVDGLADENGFKAAVATVIEIGKDLSHKTYDALITNLRSFMLVRILDGAVQHTETIELVYWTPECLPESSPPDDYHEIAPVPGNSSGFDVLVNFFEIVAAYTLKPFNPTGKGLPNELYDKIIEMVDLDTYLKCLEVSDSFRYYVQQHIRIWQQPKLISSSDQEATFSHHVIKSVSSNTSQLTIFDTVKGEEVEGYIEAWYDGNVSHHWAPVIGHGKRQSMMIDCAITIPCLASDPFPIAEDRPPEVDDPELASPVESEGPLELDHRWFGFKHFCIPQFASVSAVSIAWESYLSQTLMRSPETGTELPWAKSAVGHLFRLPRNTGLIPLGPYGTNVIDGYGNTHPFVAGMIWMKKPADLDLPLVQQRTLQEAQDYLNCKSVEQSAPGRPMRQGLLVIAFGTSTQSFEWEFSDRSDDLQPVMKPVDDGAVLNVSLQNERERFEDLFGRFLDKAKAARAADDTVQ